MTITFAHRGARLEAPENTVEAFRIGLELGARGLETDAHLSADGEVVLVHDATIRTGIRRVKVAETPAPDLALHGVPRLAELYETLGTDFELSIDLKAPAVGVAILEVARRAEAAERLWLCAPDLDTLRDLGATGDAPPRLVHSTPRRRISGPLERHAAELADAGIAAMNFHYTEWSPGLVALFQRFGLLAFAWDVQEERHLRAMLAAGLDAVYSDRVQRMVAVAGAFDSP